MNTQSNIVIIGGGAAGLMAAIWAARTNSKLDICILDGAKKIGTKILIAGGGRCNVTHEIVDAEDFAGASKNSIKKVLLRFGVIDTIEFFKKLGVELKTEETGKLFPVSNSAKQVLSALQNEALLLGVKIVCQCRVSNIEKNQANFLISGDWGSLIAEKVIVATGGKSLPKSGSDGKGFELAKHLGHSITKRIFPALVPLRLPDSHPICQISGLSVNAKLSVVNRNSKILMSFTDSMLCTHFGLSGPAVLDISRYWLNENRTDSRVKLVINWLPQTDYKIIESWLLNSKERRTVRNVLSEVLPARLVDLLCAMSAIDQAQKCHQLSKLCRESLLKNMTCMNLPVIGDRGFQFSEVTAGGVPLTEVDVKTMQSRLCSDLYLCGEICDVDGRIGGFNFQWAWASGYISGQAAAKA